MSALESFGEDIWISSGPEVVSAGFHYPTRMAVIRLDDGGLFVWSPVALTDALRAAVEACGPVRFIVTPTVMHHVFLPDWKAAWPQATLYAAPGSRKARQDIAFDADLDDTAPPSWAGQIEQVLVRGNAIATEAVFFHRRSGTVLIADLLQQFPPGWFKGWRALIAQLDGMVSPAPRVPQKFRLAFTNRRAAREALAQILAWPAEKLLAAHAPPVRENARAAITDAFKWLRKDS